MANQAGLIDGRIPPEEMFPAGDSRFKAGFLDVSILRQPMRIRVVECGDPAAEDVVLCVHGWACSVYSFRRVMPLLAEFGMRAIAIDLPGHGLSSKPTGGAVYSLGAMTECVIKSMDALGVASCVLVGHSMGAPICARLTVLATERVRGLVLLAPAGFGTQTEVRVLRALTPRLLEPLMPHIFRRWMVELGFAFVYGSLYRPTQRDIDEYWAPSQFPGFGVAMSTLLHRFEWDAGIDCGFGQIALPTAILDGQRDNFVVRRWARRYVEVLGSARLEMIEGCGHVVPEEAPEVVVAAIRAMIH